MSNFADYFRENFYRKMLTPNGSNPVRNRADSMLLIFEMLEKKNQESYSIIETGTMRADHGHLAFGDDGASTYVFDAFCKARNGQLFSIDISPQNCDHARSLVSDKTKVICDDSLVALWGFPATQKFDLVYLDSFDVIKSDPAPSQIHHLMELAAVMKNCSPGTIVCVDDHDAFFDGGACGKAALVREFMTRVGIKIAYEGYQIVFEL